MKYYIFVIVILLSWLIVDSAEAGKFNRKKMAGQYEFVAPGIFDGSVVLAKDRYTTRLSKISGERPVLGKWKFKQGKQELKIEWWSEAEFVGVPIETTEKEPQIITGIYTSAISPFQTGPATFTRIPITNDVIHHIMIGRAKRHKVKGVDFFDYGKNKVTSKIRKEYKIIAYSRMAQNEEAKREHNEKQIKRVNKYGIYKFRLHKNEFVEVYVINKEFLAPATSTNFPALNVDGTNVLAFDWRQKGFKWKKKDH